MALRIATTDDLPRLASLVTQAGRVAIDTEFHAERRYLPQLLLVQIHLPGGDTWVVDPLVPGLLEGLGDSLRRVTWIVHGGAQDLRLLQHALGGVAAQVWDTQIGAALIRPDYPAGYATLVQDLLGVHVDKGATLSDWTRRPLSPGQLAYAARDVELLFPLWDHIDEELGRLGRREACRAACEEARQVILQPPADDELWRDLQGLRHLRPQEAAIAQELVAWREGVARAEDQPPRSVLSDSLVMDLARRQPLTLEAMGENRRFPRAVVRRHGPRLLEVIQRAAARPEWAWPRYVQAGTEEALTQDFLQLWARVQGRSDCWSPRLVLDLHLLQELALLPAPVDRDQVEGILEGWRARLVAADVHAALSGKLQLFMAHGVLRTQARQA